MTSHPADDRIADYLDGNMTARERDAFELDASTDERLAATLYRDLGLRRALGMSDPNRRMPLVLPTRASWPRRLAPAIPVVALAAALALWLRPSVEPPLDPGVRVTRGEGSSMDLLAPGVDAADPPLQFVWRSVSGATTYRVDLWSAATRISQTVVSDTVWVPDSALLPPSLDGSWSVTALRDGREVAHSVGRPLRYSD